MIARIGIASLCLALFACSQQPVVNDDMMRVGGTMPADLSGSWERDYARGDDVNRNLQQAYYELARTSPDRQFSREPGPAPLSRKDIMAVTALAQLAELITRMDWMTISQTDQEIQIDREDDFSLLCAFYDGVARPTDSPYGAEVCGWDGEQLVSNLVLPDGLRITNRYTMSEDRNHLRVVTTVASNTSRVPFTLRRFYTRFDRLLPDFNCIETLSMKRVCSTGDLNF